MRHDPVTVGVHGVVLIVAVVLLQLQFHSRGQEARAFARQIYAGAGGTATASWAPADEVFFIVSSDDDCAAATE